MFLVLIILRLLMVVDAEKLDPSHCKKRFVIDCKLGKIKWFHNPAVGICLRRLTCRSGFDYRSECESTCIAVPKKKVNESSKILQMIDRMLMKYKESERRKKLKTTKPPKLSPTPSLVTSTDLLSVTTPETFTIVIEIPDLETTATYPEETTVEYSSEGYSSTTTLSAQLSTKTRRNTVKKKKVVVIGSNLTTKKSIISQIIGWGKGKG
ncbi:uncharacterized protein LOC117150562 [Drosophila mauritiana]|uniref:Uncharacterized protein LOC117150562 n=1 Tax=Drosophila mauritiana TaxID=7226 RepID=A0A6P8LDF5_DROMA|nr:uncharacterized protein LOC117150562 [Drosophila mauritiana]